MNGERQTMVEGKQPFLQLDPRDNVAVALCPLDAGAALDDMVLAEAIPGGHKFALREIPAGEQVIKYGATIGVAKQAIPAGTLVHQHNLATALEEVGEPVWNPSGPVDARESDAASITRAFEGWIRADQRVAARNEVWIINTVACVNHTASKLAEQANQMLRSRFPHVDGFHAFPHPYGCSQLGDDLQATQKILAGLINHPHAGGVLLLGLGCENNFIQSQLKKVDAAKREHVIHFNAQEVEDEFAAGMAALEQLAAGANQPRQSVPMERLILGMKCGGSDGFSGITANPLLGRIADLHCQQGGTVLLTEIPEMFGAEAWLANRCQNQPIFQGLMRSIAEFKNYFREHDQPISENPSPGNIAGGITTLEEKSLGCVQKAGYRASIVEVVGYGDRAAAGQGGVAIVNGPGNDGVSITALAAAGANLILFSTGRGTPMGASVPTMKIATNSELAARKPNWIDFDAGRLLTGGPSLEELSEDLYAQLIDVASGRTLARNEINGHREIAIWKTGVTL